MLNRVHVRQNGSCPRAEQNRLLDGFFGLRSSSVESKKQLTRFCMMTGALLGAFWSTLASACGAVNGFAKTAMKPCRCQQMPHCSMLEDPRGDLPHAHPAPGQWAL